MVALSELVQSRAALGDFLGQLLQALHDLGFLFAQFFFVHGIILFSSSYTGSAFLLQHIESAGST